MVLTQFYVTHRVFIFQWSWNNSYYMRHLVVYICNTIHTFETIRYETKRNISFDEIELTNGKESVFCPNMRDFPFSKLEIPSRFRIFVTESKTYLWFSIPSLLLSHPIRIIGSVFLSRIWNVLALWSDMFWFCLCLWLSQAETYIPLKNGEKWEYSQTIWQCVRIKRHTRTHAHYILYSYDIRWRCVAMTYDCCVFV